MDGCGKVCIPETVVDGKMALEVKIACEGRLSTLLSLASLDVGMRFASSILERECLTPSDN